MSKQTFYWKLKDQKSNTKKAINTLHHFKSFVKDIYQEQELFLTKKYGKYNVITKIVDTNSEIFASTDFLKKKDRISNKYKVPISKIEKVGSFLDTKFFILKHKNLSSIKINVPLMDTVVNTDVINKLTKTLRSSKLSNNKSKPLIIKQLLKKFKLNNKKRINSFEKLSNRIKQKAKHFTFCLEQKLKNLKEKKEEHLYKKRPAIIGRATRGGFRVYYNGLFGFLPKAHYKQALTETWIKIAKISYKKKQIRGNKINKIWKNIYKTFVKSYRIYRRVNKYEKPLHKYQNEKYRDFLKKIISKKTLFLKKLISKNPLLVKKSISKNTLLVEKQLRKLEDIKRKTNRKFLPPIRLNLILNTPNTLDLRPKKKKRNFKQFKRRFPKKFWAVKAKIKNIVFLTNLIRRKKKTTTKIQETTTRRQQKKIDFKKRMELQNKQIELPKKQIELLKKRMKLRKKLIELPKKLMKLENKQKQLENLIKIYHESRNTKK